MMDCQNGEEPMPEEMNSMGPAELYVRKYLALQRKCEHIQQLNEKLINRLHNVKKQIRRFKKDRKLLMNKLEEHSDNYQDALVPYMWEENQTPGAAGSSQATPPGGSEQGQGLSVDTSAASIVQTFASPSLTDTHKFTSPGGSGSTTKGKASPGGATGKAKRAKSEKERDPLTPKKPANAFLMFCQQQRTSVHEEYLKEHNEEISHQELTKTMALKWKALPADQKSVYYDLYEKDKERYEEELKVFTAREKPAAPPVTTPAPSVSMSTPIVPAELLESAAVATPVPIKTEVN